VCKLIYHGSYQDNDMGSRDFGSASPGTNLKQVVLARASVLGRLAPNQRKDQRLTGPTSGASSFWSWALSSSTFYFQMTPELIQDADCGLYL